MRCMMPPAVWHIVDHINENLSAVEMPNLSTDSYDNLQDLLRRNWEKIEHYDWNVLTVKLSRSSAKTSQSYGKILESLPQAQKDILYIIAAIHWRLCQIARSNIKPPQYTYQTVM